MFGANAPVPQSVKNALALRSGAEGGVILGVVVEAHRGWRRSTLCGGSLSMRRKRSTKPAPRAATQRDSRLGGETAEQVNEFPSLH